MAEQVIDTGTPTGLSQVEQLLFENLTLQLQNINSQMQNFQLQAQQQYSQLDAQAKDIFTRRVKMIADLKVAHPELDFDPTTNKFVVRPAPPVAVEGLPVDPELLKVLATAPEPEKA